ncbi:MAG: type II toxin-antitoxin system RelE/ParE family toxin [Candidatus Marinimicrobia bacterium]|nr:type II toxin-antitoxin system RelE/ParE family toxin [Candidatus Neomarinimicrobiota bacterium]
MINIIWADSARHDLLDLVEYLSDKNPKSAKEFVESIEKMRRNISKYPEIGYALDSILPVRQVLVDPARMLYIKKENAIFIIACIHQSMDWQTLLINRKIREL